MMLGIFLMDIYGRNKTLPKPWKGVSKEITQSVLSAPIMSAKAIPIKECGEPLIDLIDMKNPRIKPMYMMDAKYTNTYEGYSKVRKGLYERLLNMLEFLPSHIGIAYFEGFRTLDKQKEYFDNKFKEIFKLLKNKERAYEETCKHVSPFIDNIPTHTTGAAIDITLFDTRKHELLDMGKFDVIFGPNDQQETFCRNITAAQRHNRLLLLEAACKSGLVNYGYEWWHYSYGDKAWAFVKGADHARYGLADSESPILNMTKKEFFAQFKCPCF